MTSRNCSIKKVFIVLFLFISMINYPPPHGVPFLTQSTCMYHNLNKIEFTLYREDYRVCNSFNITSYLVLEKKVLKTLHPI